jgi:hypothetical protein
VQAYLPLDEKQQREFERLLASEPYKGVQAMRVTMAETMAQQAEARGKARGEAEGLVRGQRKTLALLLEQQFGPLPAQVRERLESLPPERLDELTCSVLRAKSLQELGLAD